MWALGYRTCGPAPGEVNSLSTGPKKRLRGEGSKEGERREMEGRKRGGNGVSKCN